MAVTRAPSRHTHGTPTASSRKLTSSRPATTTSLGFDSGFDASSDGAPRADDAADNDGAEDDDDDGVSSTCDDRSLTSTKSTSLVVVCVVCVVAAAAVDAAGTAAVVAVVAADGAAPLRSVALRFAYCAGATERRDDALDARTRCAASSSAILNLALMPVVGVRPSLFDASSRAPLAGAAPTSADAIAHARPHRPAAARCA